MEENRADIWIQHFKTHIINQKYPAENIISVQTCVINHIEIQKSFKFSIQIPNYKTRKQI